MAFAVSVLYRADMAIILSRCPFSENDYRQKRKLLGWGPGDDSGSFPPSSLPGLDLFKKK